MGTFPQGRQPEAGIDNLPTETNTTSERLPVVELEAHRYLPDGRTERIEPFVTELEDHAMSMCLDLGDKALANGNPPIGAVLLNNETGDVWGATTTDKSHPRLLAHAEIWVYGMAYEQDGKIGDDLQDYTLVTGAQPCNTCTTPYAEGNIGKIVFAAPRVAVRQIAGIMRDRKINMHELLLDGNTNTEVVSGFRAAESLAKFALYAEMRDQQAA